jgi:TPR repeat protein
MYRNGRGLKQSDVEAVKWFRKAADTGDANAQWRLGDLYRLGQGVPQDFVLAHMWFNLSAAKGEQNAIVLRELVSKHMTPEQIAEAQKLARDWKPAPPSSQD